MNRIILTKTVKNNKTYTVYALMDENGNYKDFQLLPEKDTIINNIYAARVNNARLCFQSAQTTKRRAMAS